MKDHSFSHETYTSRGDALTALTDAKGDDYNEESKDTFYWTVRKDEFADGPYTLLKTKTGKWCIA